MTFQFNKRPGPGPKIQIPSEGGMDPMWRRDGKEIFHRNASKMMAVPVSTQASFQAGKPRLLWQVEELKRIMAEAGGMKT